MRRSIPFILLTALAAFAIAANATIIEVSPEQLIQDAVNLASDGDTVLVNPGTYYQSVNFNGKNVTIASRFLTTGDPTYRVSTILDGSGIHRCFTLESGETTDARIVGFTIQNGNSGFYAGGAILCDNSSATITDNIITGCNSGGNGGTIRCYEGAISAYRNTIVGNSTDDYGGGISVSQGTAVIEDNIIRNNTAGLYGGGLYVNYSEATISGNEIVGNDADDYAGAIMLSYRANVTIANNTIVGNSCGNKGGAVYQSSGTWNTLTDNVIASNEVENDVDGQGGAIYARNVYDCTLSGNTIVDNFAVVGSAMYLYDDADPQIENSILAFNRGGSAIECETNCDPVLTCCDVYGNEGGDFVECIADQGTLENNLSEDPVFCDFANGDYSLHSSSPCLATANPCQTTVGRFGLGCDQGISLTFNYDTVKVIWAHAIDPFEGIVRLATPGQGYTVRSIDPASVFVNGSIPPQSWEILPSYPGLSGEVIEMTFSLTDFIRGYEPQWDTTVQNLTLTGSFTNRCPFEFAYEFYMIGHSSGDVNGDGVVDVSDMVALIDYSFDNGPEPRRVMAADLDRNGVLDISDVVAMVKFMFGDPGDLEPDSEG